MSAITLAAKRTEARDIVWAHDTADMLFLALGPLGTKATAVELALATLNFRRNVDVETLFRRVAKAICRVKAALWHSAQVVFMQVVARVTLFAEATEPVLAHSAAQ